MRLARFVKTALLLGAYAVCAGCNGPADGAEAERPTEVLPAKPASDQKAGLQNFSTFLNDDSAREARYRMVKMTIENDGAFSFFKDISEQEYSVFRAELEGAKKNGAEGYVQAKLSAGVQETHRIAESAKVWGFAAQTPLFRQTQNLLCSNVYLALYLRDGSTAAARNSEEHLVEALRYANFNEEGILRRSEIYVVHQLLSSVATSRIDEMINARGIDACEFVHPNQTIVLEPPE